MALPQFARLTLYDRNIAAEANLSSTQNAWPPRRPLNFQKSQMIPTTNANTIRATQLLDSVATAGW